MTVLVRKLLSAVGLIAIGMLCVVVFLYMKMLERLPDLKPWHSVELSEDFHADSPVETLADYLAVEDRAFAEMHQKILDQVESADRFSFNRFNRGSLSDPESVPTNWNRTFELVPEQARGGALLLHGLSDSPYSLRRIGQQLHEHGWLVLGMRMPAHGTAPGAMQEFNRADARAAVRIGARHLRRQLSGAQPIIIVGYSNGAALAADYVLSTLTDADLPKVDGLVMLSPAFAVAPIAAFAVWQARIGDWLGVDKLAWQSVVPEFDPYKYNSFAVRAGDQIYRLTDELDGQLLTLRESGAEGFPPTLVFQSVADATVEASAVVSRVLDRLAANGSELVLYDVNRHGDVEPLYSPNVGNWVKPLLEAPTSYSVTLLTNRMSEGDRIDALVRAPQARQAIREPLDLAWPHNVFALSHVALPFPPDDPVYGVTDQGGQLLHIGDIGIRGETGILAIPAALLTRQRHNPFYTYQWRRIREFADTVAATHSAPTE